MADAKKGPGAGAHKVVVAPGKTHTQKFIAHPTPLVGPGKNLAQVKWTDETHRLINDYSRAGAGIIPVLRAKEAELAKRWTGLRSAIQKQKHELDQLPQKLANANQMQWLAHDFAKAIYAGYEFSDAFHAAKKILEDSQSFVKDTGAIGSGAKALAKDPHKAVHSPAGAQLAQNILDSLKHMREVGDKSVELQEHLHNAFGTFTSDKPPPDTAQAWDAYHKDAADLPEHARKKMVEAVQGKLKKLTEAKLDDYARALGTGDKKAAQKKLEADIAAAKALLQSLGKASLMEHVRKLPKPNLYKLGLDVVQDEAVRKFAIDGANLTDAIATDHANDIEHDLQQAYAMYFTLSQLYLRVNHAYWSIKHYRPMVESHFQKFLDTGNLPAKQQADDAAMKPTPSAM